MFSAWVDKWINQIAHVGWGWAVALTVALFLGWPVALSSSAAAWAIKEFVFDPATETPAFSGGMAGDLEDFGFLMLGTVIGIVVFLLVSKEIKCYTF